MKDLSDPRVRIELAIILFVREIIWLPTYVLSWWYFEISDIEEKKNEEAGKLVFIV